MTNMMHKLFSMYLFLFITLYMCNLDYSPIFRMLPEAVLIQFVSPDNEHDVLETCREL